MNRFSSLFILALCAMAPALVACSGGSGTEEDGEANANATAAHKCEWKRCVYDDYWWEPGTVLGDGRVCTAKGVWDAHTDWSWNQCVANADLSGRTHEALEAGLLKLDRHLSWLSEEAVAELQLPSTVKEVDNEGGTVRYTFVTIDGKQSFIVEHEKVDGYRALYAYAFYAAHNSVTNKMRPVGFTLQAVGYAAPGRSIQFR